MSRTGQRGQNIALFIVLLPGLLAFCGLGLDAGNLYVQRRAMQAAADLAALSAAKLLPNATDAITRAQSIATANGYPSGVTVTSPYAGDPNRIEVRISVPTKTFFLPILGVNQMDVSARSVALSSPGTAPASGPSYAMFAGSNACSGSPQNTITWTGNNSTVNGLIHSNSGIKVSSGGNQWTGGTQYKCNAAFVDSGSGNVYSPTPTRVPTDISWPINYVWADFCPGTYYHATGKWDLAGNGPWWQGGTKASKRLLPGVYCADGAGAQIVLAESSVVATGVTLVSKGTIQLTANNFSITSASSAHNVVMAAYGSGSSIIKTSASTSATGVLFAPSGEIEFTGPSSGVFEGALIGWTIKVSGGNFTMNGSYAPPPGAAAPPQYQLVE